MSNRDPFTDKAISPADWEIKEGYNAVPHRVKVPPPSPPPVETENQHSGNQSSPPATSDDHK